jgi:hypothetical protein
LLLIPITIHLFLRYHADFQKKNFGTIMLIAVSYGLTVVGAAGVVSIALKADGVYESLWAIVLIPIWVNLVTVLAFAFFMCPGFLDSKISMHR